MWRIRVEQKPHPDTKLVHSRQQQVFDNKQQAPLVVTVLFTNTAASVIDVCRSGAFAHSVSQHHAIATSAVPEDVARPDFVPYASSSPQERWHGGQVKAHLSAIGGPQGPPASGSKSSKGLSGAACNDPMSKHGRLNLGILMTKNRNTYTKLGLPRSRSA